MCIRDSLQQVAAGPADLFIAADQEGGAVQQLKGKGFTVLPAALDQGKLPPSELTALGTTLAAELRSAGVNVNLAPVADTVPPSMVQTNAPIGKYRRELGNDPAVVAAAVPVLVTAVQAGKVVATIKHFPGLGRITGNILKAQIPGLPRPLARMIANRAFGWFLTSEDLPNPASRGLVRGDDIVVDWQRSNMDAHHMLIKRTRQVMRRAGFPVVLVVGMRLGCINHALLSAEAIRSDGLALAGWVANQIDPGQARATENFATLAAMLEAPCIARVPWSDGASAQFMAAHLDLDALRKGAGTLTRRAML